MQFTAFYKAKDFYWLLSGQLFSQTWRIMRLTIVFLIISLLQVSARGYTQNITLSKKQISLKRVFAEIEKQSGYQFFYNEKLLAKASKVSLSLRNATLAKTLDACFENQPFTYSILNKTIIIKEKAKPQSQPQTKAIPLSDLIAPPVKLKGRVVDEKGVSLPGVTIAIKGMVRSQGTATITDSRGFFSLEVPSSAKTIVASFIGYQSKEVTVASQMENLTIVLLPDNQQLSAVVVTAYGSQSRTVQTGAISQIKGEDVANIPLTSVDKALQGKVAGLQSTGGSGQPGSFQDVRIRGIGSFSASSAPLYVIDGIPVNSGTLTQDAVTSNALSGINPDDIESISVLKDASASSVYGSRAANGVIIITTKKGRVGTTRIKVDAEAGTSSQGFMSDQNRPLNTTQWKELTMEGLLNSPSAVANFSLTPANVSSYVDATYRTNNGVNTDWIDVITRTAAQQQYNMAADGGNDKTLYHLSGGYFKQDGVVLASQFDRYSVNLNVNHKVSDRLSLSSGFITSYSTLRGPSNGGADDNPVLAAYFLLPMYSPRNADGSLNITAPDFPVSGISNPVAIAEMDKRKSGMLKGLGSLSAEYKITRGFKFTSKYGVDYNNIEEDRYFNPYYGGYSTYSGAVYRSYLRYFNWVWTNLFDYTGAFLSDQSLRLNVKMGYEAQKSQTYTNTTQVLGMPPNLDIEVPSAGSSYKTITGTNSDYAFAAMLAMADISYEGKYVLSGSFRRDGSSRFGENNRYGNFWSVGASWNMEKEQFIQDLPWITQLKIRGSYGLNGNAGIGNYDWRQLYGYSAGYNYLGQSGSAPVAVGNPNLTWEVNKPLDLGLDLALFKNRLALTAEWYSRKTSNLLLNEPLSPTSGFGSYSNNVGSMRNRGFEVSLSGTPVMAGGFRWDMNFNFSHNKNEILALVNNADQVSTPFIRRVGEDFQSFYLPLWAGVNPENGDPLWYTDGSKTSTTNVYNMAKFAIAGSASPKYFGGFGSQFSYKGVSLDGLFYYNFGNLVRDTYAKYTQSDGQNPGYNRVASQLNRWQKPGDLTNVPKYIYGGNQGSNSNSSRYLYKGDYVRLRNLTLSYSLPADWLTKLKVANMKIYARGTNLWTWVKDKNLTYDPEMAVTSTTTFDVYIPRTYTVGVNVGF